MTYHSYSLSAHLSHPNRTSKKVCSTFRGEIIIEAQIKYLVISLERKTKTVLAIAVTQLLRSTTRTMAHPEKRHHLGVQIIRIPRVNPRFWTSTIQWLTTRLKIGLWLTFSARLLVTSHHASLRKIIWECRAVRLTTYPSQSSLISVLTRKEIIQCLTLSATRTNSFTLGHHLYLPQAKCLQRQATIEVQVNRCRSRIKVLRRVQRLNHRLIASTKTIMFMIQAQETLMVTSILVKWVSRIAYSKIVRRKTTLDGATRIEVMIESEPVTGKTNTRSLCWSTKLIWGATMMGN